MRQCERQGCRNRTFMDSDRCFDHQRSSRGFLLWFAFCATVGIAVLGVALWAVVVLVLWVTS